MKPGGTFFFEMGGHGNAPEMVTAFIRDGGGYVKNMLESVGFQVKMIKLDPQPLELTTSDNGGLEGFMRLIGAQMLDILDTEEEKNSAIEQICRMLRYGTIGEDGSQWITYASLRCVAVKP
ncbi:unnamed protein product [Penicillium glandicola]